MLKNKQRSLTSLKNQYLYFNLIKELFAESNTGNSAEDLVRALTQGHTEEFALSLQNFVATSMSVYDLPVTEPEKSYHLFVLGLLVMLKDTYHITSNRESGFGRYDIMLVPYNKTKPGIIIEFKKISTSTSETLERAADRALEQIQERNYAQQLRDLGIRHIIAYGIAFQGKKLLVKSQNF